MRVNDIVQEVKRQIGSIERQAKKAESYKVEFEKLKSLELAVASREFLVFDHKRKAREEGLAELRKEEEESAQLMQAAETGYNGKRRQLLELDERLKDSYAEEVNTASEIRKNQDRLLLNRERIGELAQRKEHLSKQIEALRRRVEKVKEEYGQWNVEFEVLQKEEAEGLAFLNSVEGRFNSLENAITQSFTAVVIIPFSALERIDVTLNTLFAEAGETNPGRQVMLDRLCDILLIQIVRFAIQQELVTRAFDAGAHHRLDFSLRRAAVDMRFSLAQKIQIRAV